MTPKSLLRLPAATSTLDELAAGAFQPILDDPVASKNPAAVRRLVLCSGKIYYDLASERDASNAGHVAIVRAEQLYPWPHEELSRIVARYPNISEVVWAQEEPQNMGAWSYVAPLLPTSIGALMPLVYVGRHKRASPAEGYLKAHQEEQNRIVGEVIGQPVARAAAPEQKEPARVGT